MGQPYDKAVASGKKTLLSQADGGQYEQILAIILLFQLEMKSLDIYRPITCPSMIIGFSLPIVKGLFVARIRRIFFVWKY